MILPTPLLSKSLRRAPAGGIFSFAGGQFIPVALWNGEKQKAKDALPGLLDRTGERLQLLRQVYEQNSSIEREGVSKVKLVSLPAIERQLKAEVRSAYDEAFLLGKRAAGNLFALTEADSKAIKAIRLDEYTYLRGFLRDIREQDGKMVYEKRADYYVQATRELFNLGFVIGNQTPGRFLRWKLGETEHCATCMAMAKLGWLSVQEFIKQVVSNGYLPQSGRLDCLGYRCQCDILEEFRKQ